MSQIRHVYVKFDHILYLNYTSMNVIMCNCSWKELFINCQSISNQEVAGRKTCRGQMGLRPSLLLLSISSDSSLQPPPLHLTPCKAALFHQIHMLATYIKCVPYKQLLLLLSSCCPSDSSPSSLPLLIPQPEAASSLTLCVWMWVTLYVSMALCNLSLSRVGPV